MKITPSHLLGLQQVQRFRGALPEHALILGGETSDERLVRRIQRDKPDCRLINHYGPTETTVGVLTYELNQAFGETAFPIGRPLQNAITYILSSDLAPVPLGVVGELYIGGAGLARGYHGRPGLTAERFVPNPFARTPGERLYRTGDLARWRTDGAIDYVGRIDHQVKIRGFRVELGEIEARLVAHAEVREAAAVAREGASSKQIVTYVVPQPGAGDAATSAADIASQDIDRASPALAERLSAHLRAVLPDYMVPARIVVLEAMPLTPNGKLDRKALPEPDFAGAGVGYVAPRSETERKLVAIWQEVLGLEKIGVTDNFFELGGDSILSLQIIARARREGIKITLNRSSKIRHLRNFARHLTRMSYSDRREN